MGQTKQKIEMKKAKTRPDQDGIAQGQAKTKQKTKKEQVNKTEQAEE
jgi:hypothetical protein